MMVTDWDRVPTQANVAEDAHGNGEIYTCRESPATVSATSTNFQLNNNGDIGLQFTCKDSCENTDTQFYWRITSSHEPPKQEGVNAQGEPIFRSASSNDERFRDEENWCLDRDGADYPASLLSPYPQIYNEPVIFGTVTTGASSAGASSALLAFLALAV